MGVLSESFQQNKKFLILKYSLFNLWNSICPIHHLSIIQGYYVLGIIWSFLSFISSIICGKSILKVFKNSSSAKMIPFNKCIGKDFNLIIKSESSNPAFYGLFS